MKLTEGKLRSIVREEILRERVGSKELSPRKLEKVLRNYVVREYGLSKSEARDLVTVYDQDFKLEVNIPEELLESQNWNQYFKKYGYFIKAVYGENDGYPTVELHLMPYDSKKIPRENLPRMLRHATPMNKVLKVIENGLVPNETEKVAYGVDEPRIYFAESGEKFDQLVQQLKRKIPEKPPFGNEIAELSISPDDVRKEVNFYSDPEVLGDEFFYADKYIRPQAIFNDYMFKDEMEILRKRKN